MKSILVTGGAGYIGSHACKLLSLAGYAPITYDNLSTGHSDAVKWGPLITGDLQDTQKLSHTIKRYQPVAVIHFAASAYVGESVLSPLKYYQNNVGGTLSLLDAMSSEGVNKLVFSSTCATYGTPDLRKINESCPQHPINPYGQSKLMVEKILDDLAAQGQLNYISLRYFNAVGADKDGQIGERHDPETHLVPLAIQSALGGLPLKVFGADFCTLDGTAVRDYIHVEDIGGAHILAVEHLLNGGHSDYINLGVGKGYSVKEIISALKNLGLQVNSIDAPRRPGDPAYLVADNSKAKTILNWQPQYKHIQDILKSAINWHQQHG